MSCDMLLGPRYHRINPSLPYVGLDDSLALSELLEHAERLDLSATHEFMRTEFLAKDAIDIHEPHPP